MTKGYIDRFWPYGVVLLLPAIVFFITLSNWKTTDEVTWISNGIKFEQALLQHNWSHTRLTTRPGVTVEWVVALTSQLIFGRDTLLSTPPDDLTTSGRLITPSRVAIISCLLTLTLLTYFLLRKLISSRIALFSTLLISIHPIFTASTYLVWTDIFLTYLMLLTILAFLVFIKNNAYRYIFLTGLFFGLALLTKVISVVAMPILLFLTLYSRGSKHRLLNAVGMIILIGLLVFYALYPAAWLNPRIILDRTQEVDVSYSHPYAVVFNQPVWHYPLFLFLIDPPLIVLSLLCLYMAIRTKNNSPDSSLTFSLFSAALLYFIVIIATSFLKDNGLFAIRSDRYLAPVIPFLLIGSLNFLSRRPLTEILSVGLGIYYLATLFHL